MIKRYGTIFFLNNSICKYIFFKCSVNATHFRKGKKKKKSQSLIKLVEVVNETLT